MSKKIDEKQVWLIAGIAVIVCLPLIPLTFFFSKLLNKGNK